MREIRFHGRGGQGAVSAADVLAAAALFDGQYGVSFPMYGTERRGAPVVAFVRIDGEPVRQNTQVYTPDCLIVLDSRQAAWPQTYEGVRNGAALVVNLTTRFAAPPHEHIRVAGVVDATRIALDEIGLPAVGTAMLGAFAAATGIVGLEALVGALAKTFSGDLLAKNIRSVERGFREVNICHWPDRAGEEI